MSGRRLQARLFLVAAGSIAVALLVVALLTRHAAHLEFRTFERLEHATRVHDLAATVSARLGRDPDSSRLDSVLAELGRSEGRGILVVSAAGERLGASSPELRSIRVSRGPHGELVLEQEVVRAGMRERRRVLIASAPQAAVRRADGAVLGTLVLLPGSDLSGGAQVPFGASFDLRLLLAALIAALAALALSWALSKRILGPVEALTAAAGRLGRGDLTSRVPAAGSDELGELSRAFNAMAEDLGRQESVRRTLMSDVAHELRTPLTNLRAQLEAVEDGLLPASAETVRSLREEVLLLARLVEDLQTLAVADAGRLALDRATVQVRDVVEGVVEGTRAFASGHGVTLENLVGDLPPVHADPGRIGQVLRNLVVNAVTHTPSGGRVTIGAAMGEGRVRVTVSDNGHGIAAEHLTHLFDRFYRADPSRARDTGGAGLGLAIVKSIVEAHGGTVDVTSAPGAGSTFGFTLPLATS